MDFKQLRIEFTPEELETLDKSLQQIEGIITSKAINLTPEERQLYGKLGNRTMDWVRKVSEYIKQKPEYIPFYLKVDQFNKDQKAREVMVSVLNRLTAIHESVDDTSKLLSTDIYNAAIAYYRNIKLISQQNVPGTTSIFQDLSAQFSGRKNTALAEDPPTKSDDSAVA